MNFSFKFIDFFKSLRLLLSLHFVGRSEPMVKELDLVLHLIKILAYVLLRSVNILNFVDLLAVNTLQIVNLLCHLVQNVLALVLLLAEATFEIKQPIL